MQKLSTPETTENASDDPLDIYDALLTAESKAISLHTMATALSDLLGGPFDEQFSPAAKRRIAAAFQVAWSIEEMAEASSAAIRAGLDIAYAERRAREQSTHAADAMRAPMADRRAPADAASDAVLMHSSLVCSHDQMVEFSDAVMSMLDGIGVARLALMNSDWITDDDLDSIGVILDREYKRGNALRADMYKCFLDWKPEAPRSRLKKVAQGGAA